MSLQNRYYNTPLFIGPMPLAATYRRVVMKALARCQIILLGEQRHIGVNNLPKVVARQCSGRELNQRPPDHESNTLATTPPSHLMKSALLLLLILKARKMKLLLFS